MKSLQMVYQRNYKYLAFVSPYMQKSCITCDFDFVLVVVYSYKVFFYKCPKSYC